MRVVLLTCRRCAAPLNLPPFPSRRECPHCGLRIRFKLRGGVEWGAVGGQEQVERLERSEELEELDRAWSTRRRALLVHRAGQTFVPGPAEALALLALGLWAYLRLRMEPDTPRLDWVLLLILAACGAHGLRHVVLGRRFRRESAEFRLLRRDLMRSSAQGESTLA